MFVIASSLVLPWLMHPGKLGRAFSYPIAIFTWVKDNLAHRTYLLFCDITSYPFKLYSRNYRRKWKVQSRDSMIYSGYSPAGLFPDRLQFDLLSVKCLFGQHSAFWRRASDELSAQSLGTYEVGKSGDRFGQ